MPIDRQTEQISPCKRCGAPIRSDAPLGQCPKCLLNVALDHSAVHPDDGTKDESPSKLRLFRDYELLELIARGGMGLVYRARQISLNRIVALKMISTGDLASPVAVERFRTEAEAAARLEHPNIVPIYEIGLHQDQHYFTMRFLEGGTLTDAIARERFTPRRTAELMITVARAVHFAHQHGVLHRDLKPGNILLDSYDEPQVTDFGLAKLLESDSNLTRPEAILGTPNYIAPEQATGDLKRMSTAADIFSLGAVLYELLTGRPPFAGKTPLETIRRVTEAAPQRPRLVNSEVDADLETVCLKALEKDPACRYGSAEGLAVDLERWSRGEAILARPVSSFERTLKWARRRPAITALFVMSCLTMLAFVGVFSANHLKNEERALRKQFEVQLMRANEAQKAEARARSEIASQKAAAESAREAEAYQRERAEAENRKSAANLYLATIAWAELELNAKNLERVNSLLDACPAHLRHWEWHYLKRRSEAELAMTKQYETPILSVSFDHDGESIISVPAKGGPTRWNPFTRSESSLAMIGMAPYMAATVSPLGQRLATLVTEGQRIECFDRSGSVFSYRWEHTSGLRQGSINPFAFSKNAGFLVTVVNRSKIVVWDTESESRFCEYPATDQINSFAFHPGGELLAWTTGVFTDRSSWKGSGTCRIAKLGSDTDPVRLTKSESPILCSVWSPDGRWLAAGDADGVISVWEFGDFEVPHAEVAPKLKLTGHSDSVFSLAFSEDSTQMASGGADYKILVWNIANGEIKRSYSGHSAAIRTLAFNPTGHLLVSGGDDSALKVWNLATPPRPLTIKATTAGLAFSPDSKRITSGNSIWSLPDGKPLAEFTGSKRRGRPAFSSDGKYVASGPNLVDAERGLLMTRIETGFKGRDSPYGVSFSPDILLLAAGQGDEGPGIIKIFDLRSGNENRTLNVSTNPVWDVAYSPNGRFLAAASGTWKPLSVGGPGAATLLDSATGEMVQLHHTRLCLYSVCFSGDGQLFAASGGAYNGLFKERERGEIKVWNVTSGEEVFSRTDLTSCVYSIALSPDGRRIVAGIGPAGESGPFEVRLFDVETDKELLILGRHARAVHGVAYSPDGKQIAAGGSDGLVQVWSIK